MTNRKKEAFQIATEKNYTSISEMRLDVIKNYDYLITSGSSQVAALQALRISRRTLYRWKKLYRYEGILGLETYSTRPNKIRKPIWTAEMKKRVLSLRLQYPIFGKDKIAVMYKRKYNEKISATTTGKILNVLLKEHKIQAVSDISGKHIPKARKFTGHAQRLPKGMKSKQVGELIQIDQMTINVPGIGERKEFHAICPVSKFIVTKTYKKATSRSGKDFFDYARANFPFPMLSAQVDGGSEFMDEFEKAFEKSWYSFICFTTSITKN
jgi:transposase